MKLWTRWCKWIGSYQCGVASDSRCVSDKVFTFNIFSSVDNFVRCGKWEFHFDLGWCSCWWFVRFCNWWFFFYDPFYFWEAVTAMVLWLSLLLPHVAWPCSCLWVFDARSSNLCPSRSSQFYCWHGALRVCPFLLVANPIHLCLSSQWDSVKMRRVFEKVV